MQSEFSCLRLTLNNFPKLKYNLLTFGSAGVRAKGRNVPSGRLNIYIEIMRRITVDMNVGSAIILSDKSRRHNTLLFSILIFQRNFFIKLPCFRAKVLTGVLTVGFRVFW